MILCALLLGWMVYRYDMHDREPWLLLLLAAALGYGAMWGVGHLEDKIHETLGVGVDVRGQALVAAFCEELAKLLLVALIALAFRRHFNDPMDGLIYGAFVGLGMGVAESVFYLGIANQLHIELVGTELVRLLLHLITAGLSGFAVGMAATRMKRWPLFLAVWLTASMTLHFFWDYLVGLPQMTGANAGWESRLAAAVLMIAGISLFGFSVVLANRWSRQVFAPKSKRRLWGWPFV